MQQLFQAIQMIISSNFHIVEVITSILGHFGKFGFSIVLEHKRHMTTLLVFPSSREKISQPGLKPPTTPFDFGYMIVIIH